MLQDASTLPATLELRGCCGRWCALWIMTVAILLGVPPLMVLVRERLIPPVLLRLLGAPLLLLLLLVVVLGRRIAPCTATTLRLHTSTVPWP